MPPITTLKVRSEYLAVRGGSRASVAACLIEAKLRTKTGEPHKGLSDGPRFGFTVTKKLGNAVTRNRIRRRLKAAISQLAAAQAQPGFDYVVVARPAAFDRRYEDIIADLTRAFSQLHGTPKDGSSPAPVTRSKNQPGKAQP